MSSDSNESAQSVVKQIPRALKQLFEQFDDAGVRWALLRPLEGLVSSEGDIDILVDASAMGQVRAILLRSGYLEMRTGGTGLHMATYDDTLARFIWVHVQASLKAGGLAIPAKRLLETVTGKPLPELAPEWLLWSLLIRAMDKRHIPVRYRERLRRLALEWRSGPAELEQAVIARGIDPRELVDAAANGHWEDISGRSWTNPNDSARTSRGSRWMSAMRSLGSLFSKRGRGISVAVIGPDGAGKSTLVDGLHRTLPVPSRVVYMGLTGGKMSRARRLRLPGLVFAAQAALLWLRFIDAMRHCAAGRIVLFERYVLDGAVSAGTPLSPLQQLARRAQRRILPVPDLVVLLDASGKTMYDRKGEYSPETLEAWRLQYRGLEATVKKLVVIDAERDSDYVLRSAQRLIWERLRERSA